MKWYQHARCAGDDLHRYVLDMGPGRIANKDRQGAARTLCMGCPVIEKCAQDALEFDDSGVVRGGVWIPPKGAPGYSPSRTRQTLESVAYPTRQAA